MAVSYSSNRVTVGTYKSGTTTANSTTNLQITSGQIAAGDIGRLVAIVPSTSATAGIQVRKITGVSGGTISIHDPWVGTIPSGTVWRVAHTAEDVHAIGNAALQKVGERTYRWDADWSLSTDGFFGDLDISLEMAQGSGTSWPMGNNSVVQFGILWGGEGAGVQTTEGCRIRFRSTGNNISIYSNSNDRNGNGGVTNYYNCLVHSATSSWMFQRMTGPTRFIGTTFDGPMGGRFYHEASEWVQCRMSGNDNTTPAWSLGATFTRPISEVFSYRNLRSMKSYLDFGGVLRNVTFANNGTIFGRDGNSPSVFQFIDCTEFTQSETPGNGGVLHQDRSINVTVADSDGSPIEGVAFRVANTNGTVQGSINQSDAGGVLPELYARRFTSPHGSTALQSFAPFNLRYRKYGFRFSELSSTVADPIKQQVVLRTNNFVVVNEATAGGYTGIAINGVAKTIDVTSARTLQELYDYSQEWAAQTGNMGYDEPITTADGINFAVASGWVLSIDNTFSTGSQVLAGGVIEYNAPGTFTQSFGSVQINMEATGTYNFSNASFGGSLTVDTISNATVTIQVPTGVSVTNNDPANITVSAPVVSLTVNSSEAGSLIQIFDTGTTTLLDSATGNSLSYEHGSETVDIVVQKAGFIPQRQTGIVLSGSSTISFTLIEDLNYLSDHGLTYTTDYTINMASSEIAVLTPATARDVYSAVVDSFIAGDGDTANKRFPLSMNGPSTLFLNDVEFASGSIPNLSRTGFSYVASGVVVATYAAIQTTTLPSSTKIWRLSENGGSWVLQDTGTGIDGMLQVYGDASHGDLDNRDFLTFKATNDGYTVGEWNLISDGGVADIGDLFYFVPLSIIETGETAGDPGALSITVTNIADTLWNGITVGVEIEADPTVSGSDILRYLTWQRHQGNFLQYGQLVEPLGDAYTSVRGRVYDGPPLEVEGVRVVLSTDGTAHPDFVRFEGNTGAYVVPTPPATYGLSFSGLESGSSVRIFNTGTQTIIDNTESSGATFEWSVETTGSITVDYTVQKVGFLPIRVTGVTLTAAETGGVLSVSVNQSEDRSYVVSSGLTYGTTATVNTTTKEVTVSTNTTVRNWYSFMVESWISQATLYNESFPFISDGPNSYTLSNGWEWGDGATSIGFLSRNGMRYVDESNTVTAIYAAIQTTEQPSGTKIWRLSADGGAWSLQSTGTGFDGILQVYGDVSHGNIDDQDFLTYKATNDGYTIDEWNVIDDGGALVIEDAYYFVPLTITQTGETSGDPSVTGVTVTNIADTVWNGITVGVEIVVDPGVSGSDVLRYITWERHQGNMLQYGQLVEPLGSGYKSVRGRVYDGTPLETEGVRVIVSGGTDPHPDFATFEGNTGSYTPPVTVVGSVTVTQAGSRVQIYNVTTDTELFNDIVSGTFTSLSQFSSSATYWSPGDTIRIRAAYQNGLDATAKAETTVVVGGGEEWSANIAQETCVVYDAYGIDGSTVTEFSWDSVNVQFDVNDPDNTWYVSRLFAWDKYWTATEVGIRESFSYMEAVDAGNIRIDNACQLDNLRAQTAIQGDNIRLFHPNGTLPVTNPTTGGGGFSFYSTGTIFTVATGSAVTAQDKSDIISGVWGHLIETGYTAQQTHRIIVAALAGKLSGADGSTITIRDILDNKNRIVATVDSNGNRTAVTLDGS